LRHTTAIAGIYVALVDVGPLLGLTDRGDVNGPGTWLTPQKPEEPQKVTVRDGHVSKPEYQEPFDVLFSVPRFEYGTAVGRTGLEPVTPCASCVFDSFRAVHPGPSQTADQDFLFTSVHCRS
jgi:hypothetical protein